MTATATPKRPGTVLKGVPWDVYLSLRELPENDRVRMTYHDGTLILTSPEYIHDGDAWLLDHIVCEVALAADIELVGAGSTTFRREGEGESKGDAKEPDASYYVAENEAWMRGKEQVDLEIDPPPDLAIEVDNKSDSTLALKTYAGLRVPEVWRYDARAKTLWFGRLVDGNYETIERSLCLPSLTPHLVLFAMDRATEQGGTSLRRWLRGWAEGLPMHPN